MNSQYKYLALGDSYTIGKSVESEKTWPYFLRDYLTNNGFSFSKPEVIADNSWRTAHLLEAIDKANFEQKSFDLVSLLIGVNNQYDETPFDQFVEEFELLLQKAISFNKYGATTTFVVGIPDYSLTVYAQKNGKADAAADIKRHNAVAQEICEKYQVVYYSIFELSQQMADKPQFFIEDELHPSADQYYEWTQHYGKNVLKTLSNAL